MELFGSLFIIKLILLIIFFTSKNILIDKNESIGIDIVWNCNVFTNFGYAEILKIVNHFRHTAQCLRVDQISIKLRFFDK